MQFWILSPNVTNNSEDEPFWKKIIIGKGYAIIGWDEDNKLGRDFIEVVQPGDFILVAQGANRNKRLFIGGIVVSEAKYEKFEGAPRETYYRTLTSILSQKALESLKLNFEDSAFGAANLIPAIYRLYPEKNKADKEITRKILDYLKQNQNRQLMDNIVKLLEYKKQIILQGPPGTGKTRMAKLVARQLTKPDEIIADDLKLFLSKGQKVLTSTEYTYFTILDFTPSHVNIKLGATGKEYGIRISDIVEAYKNKIWQTGEIKNGNDTYTAAISKFIYESDSSFQNMKIIQFHPAYSYEDFVRGITVKTNGTQSVEYRAEDKIIAQLAKDAFNNYRDSKREANEVSTEKWIDMLFDEFKDSIDEYIEENEKYAISRKAYIFELEDDAFRYKGDNWSTSFRMPYREIVRLYHLGITSRKEMKHHPLIMARTNQHATYYFNVLTKFKEFIGDRKAPESGTLKVRPLNYVLIIDEINRANLPAVLGELIYALEYRYDEKDPESTTVELTYDIDGDRKLTLPPNLYIIGTMNTSDRSVSHIDYAIRRRFAFVELLPNSEPIKDFAKEKFKLVSSLFISNYDSLNSNSKVLVSSVHLPNDIRPEDVWIGHSYFITKDYPDDVNNQKGNEELNMRLRYEVVPILKEYVKDGVLKKSAEEIINSLV